MRKTRIFIADDHAMVRMGLAALLEAEDDFKVVGEAEDGESTVSGVLRLEPDIVLMDLMMPKMDGTEATAAIHAKSPRTKIALLTSTSSSDDISRAIRAGASGAILKSADFTQLVSVLRRIAAGERVISPEVLHLLAEDPPVPCLTPRQEEVLESIVRGFTYADIARRFGIREGSVKEHVALICEKLGAANKAEAIAIAMRKHLLKP